MTQRTNVVLLAALITATAGAQDVNVYGTTMAQMWKQDVPGFDKTSYAPATQFLGIDATKLGTEALSLHLFGWGRVDLGEATSMGKKSDGNLTYGYLQYRFAEANAEIKAGRFAINQGAGMEQVDGISARTDLKHGFVVSFFAGKPVIYKSQDPADQRNYEFQHDVIFGGRVGWRLSRMGEVGVSYLQDGSTAAKDLPIASIVDYSRRQVGADIHFVPIAAIDFTGRTIWDVAHHAEPLSGTAPSRIAEHDYTMLVKIAPLFSMTGDFTERNFQAYYAGTNMPSLFRPDERGKHRGYGGKILLGSAASLLVTADFRSTNRDSFGEANRFGGDVRWTGMDSKLQAGFGAHRVTTQNVLKVDRQVPSYSLSHREIRAWVMYETGRYSASLDGIHQSFDDQHNPNLNGKKAQSELVASLGARLTPSVKVSGDLTYGDNPFFKKDVRALLRAEYRFSLARKGGK